MKRRIEVRACSIVATGADIVVNASNDSATLGGGVSRALFDECGGAVLQDEMRRKLADDLDGVIDADDCLVTSAGTSTRIRHLLHVAAVDYRGVERSVSSAERIQSCTEAALRAAADLAQKEQRELSLAFPLLGAGSGGLPVDGVCNAMIAGLRAFFGEQPEAAIAPVVFAVPEPDRFETCSRLVDAAFG